jgi:hypothetical protein
VRMPYVFVIVTPLPHVVADVHQGRRTRMLQKSSKTGRTGPRAKPTDEGTKERVGYPSRATVRGPRDAYPERTRTAVCDLPRYLREPSFRSSVNAWRTLRAKIHPSSRRIARSPPMATAAENECKRSARAIPSAETASRPNRGL